MVAGASKVQRRTLQTVAAITLVALILRCIRLDGALWTDEMYTVHIAQRPLSGLLSDEDQTPPLFALMLHAWMQVAGSGDLAVRIPPLILGTLTVPSVFFVARRYTSDRGALLATAMAAFAVYPIILSQETRAYGLLMALSVASALALLRLQERWSAGRAAAYVAAAALMLYSHVFGTFFLLAHNLHALLPGHPRRIGAKRWVALQAAIGTLFLPWIPRLLDSSHRISQGFWILPPRPIDAFWTFYVVAGGWLPMVLTLILVAVAITVARRVPGRNVVPEPTPASGTPGLRLVVFWLLVPLGVPVLVSFWFPIFTPRYMAPLAVPALVLAAVTVEAAGALRKPLAIACVAAFALTAGLFFAAGQLEDSRQDWKGTVGIVESHAAPGAVLVFNAGLCESGTELDLSCVYERYASRDDVRMTSFFREDRGVARAINATSVAELDGVVGNATQVWIVYSYPSDTARLIPQRLQGLGFHELQRWDLKRIELIEFQR